MSTESLRTAIEHVGSMNALAEKLGITKGAVHQWTLGGRRVPADRCIPIELATGGAVTRYDLRPDIFGAPRPPLPPDQSEAA